MKVLGIVIFVLCLLALATLLFFEIKSIVKVIRDRKKKDIEKKGE